jgi:PAS domain S-box-containing protein
VRETVDRYQRLVERSPNGIFISQDARVVFLNAAALQLVGASTPDPILGTLLRDVFHVDSRPLLDDLIEQWQSGRATPMADARIVRLDGTIADVDVTGVAVDDADGAALQIIVRDITQRRRAEAALRDSEERLTLAFAGAQEGVWDWDLTTGAVVYSHRWKEMLGYADDEIEPHLSAWERLLHPDDMPRAQQASERVARGEQAYEGEFRLRHKDGRYIHVLSRGYPVRREPGGPAVRIVGTHFDLTERKHAEEMLRRAHDELEARVIERTAELARANAALREEMGERERAERARTELLGRLMFAQEDERRRIAREMHDQFGEQLTALGRRIGLLKDACRDQPDLVPHVEALEVVSAQIDRDVDHLVWELRPTALDDLGLRAALANYVANWSKRVAIPAELHTNGLLDDRLSSEVETTLYRIAQEALTNVAKHAQARHVEIILERRPDHVLLIVEDDGIGFDHATPGASGEGFGLRGMEERAALVGATVLIDSATGRGTTVLVRMAAAASTAGTIGQA